MSRRSMHGIARTVTAVVAAAVLASCGNAESRQEEVAARGALVMPFDLDATTHRWSERHDGLEQTIVADDPADAAQVALIREHLRREAEAFAAGDFRDPAAIHGAEMPGLAALRTHDGRITVTYDDIAGGGRLVFVTADAALVEALHAWATAQVVDHGQHAEH